jgi:hypothetical protein
MKKIAIVSAAALLAASGAAFAQERVVASNDLNVRAGPGTNHRVIGSIAANDSVNVWDCTGNWCRVSYRGGEGWASARYLAPGGGERFADERYSGRSRAGTASGAAAGAIGGAIIGGPVGAVVGGVVGGGIGATADATGREDGRNRGAATGGVTGAIGGAIVGGPIGAVVGGLAGTAIGTGVDVSNERGIDRTRTSSTTPDYVPRSAYRASGGERTAVWYKGQYLEVETDSGRVIGRLN